MDSRIGKVKSTLVIYYLNFGSVSSRLTATLIWNGLLSLRYDILEVYPIELSSSKSGLDQGYLTTIAIGLNNTYLSFRSYSKTQIHNFFQIYLRIPTACS